jgi:hypothetical protein
MPTEIHITEGDVTEMAVDAIVNAPTSLDHIHFVLYDHPTLKVFQDTYQKLISQAAGE